MPIRAAYDTQRHARRLPIGPVVVPRARGAFTAFSLVLVCGPATIANQRLPVSVLQVLQVLQQRRAEAD